MKERRERKWRTTKYDEDSEKRKRDKQIRLKREKYGKEK